MTLPADYFTAQIRKSEAKIAWHYGRLLALAGISQVAGLRVLDVGCGAAPGLRYLRRVGATAIGIDTSGYALSMAQALVPDALLVRGDAMQGLPCVDQTIDVVLLSEVVEHVTHAEMLLHDCMRVLRIGGRIIITTPNLWDIRRWLVPLWGEVWSGDTDPTHINLYTPPRLVQQVRAAGFEQIRRHTGFKPAFWLSSRRLRMRMPIPYPPFVGNGLLVTGVRTH